MPRDSAARELDLEGLQRWMQEVVVYPGSVDEAISSDGAQRLMPADRLAQVVLPSHCLTPVERVGVYHGMYLLRMEAALASDYPVIRHVLGDETFAELVRDYVVSYPSRSYTLNRLGDHLPRFLSERSDWSRDGFLHDLARLELAMTEVFDEEESPILDSEQLAAVPPQSWEAARLRPIAALRLLELDHAVIPHLVAYHRNRPSPKPRRTRSWVAVYRCDYSVRRLELKRAEYGLLGLLISGVPLGEALADAAAGADSARQQARVFKMFRTWVAEGVFSGVDVTFDRNDC